MMKENPLTDPRASISLDRTNADAHGLSEVEPELNLIKELSRTGFGVQGEFGYSSPNFRFVEFHCLEEMEKFTGCLLQSKRSEIPGLIEETESAIAFLNGSTPLNGNFFDPELGTWNTAYYEEYLSAQDFLKDSRRNAV